MPISTIHEARRRRIIEESITNYFLSDREQNPSSAFEPSQRFRLCVFSVFFRGSSLRSSSSLSLAQFGDRITRSLRNMEWYGGTAQYFELVLSSLHHERLFQLGWHLLCLSAALFFSLKTFPITYLMMHLLFVLKLCYALFGYSITCHVNPGGLFVSSRLQSTLQYKKWNTA